MTTCFRSRAALIAKYYRSPTAASVMSLRLDCGMTFQEIADELGISRQAVWQTYQRFAPLFRRALTASVERRARGFVATIWRDEGVSYRVIAERLGADRKTVRKLHRQYADDWHSLSNVCKPSPRR